MEWISIHDRLPEEGVPVLVTQHQYSIKTKPRYYQICEYFYYSWVDANDGADADEPTHWMPLPNFPEK